VLLAISFALLFGQGLVNNPGSGRNEIRHACSIWPSAVSYGRGWQRIVAIVSSASMPITKIHSTDDKLETKETRHEVPPGSYANTGLADASPYSSVLRLSSSLMRLLMTRRAYGKDAPRATAGSNHGHRCRRLFSPYGGQRGGDVGWLQSRRYRKN
jgi:hypothetical protein